MNGTVRVSAFCMPLGVSVVISLTAFLVWEHVCQSKSNPSAQQAAAMLSLPSAPASDTFLQVSCK
jgi:hypothetical protein